MTLFWWAIMHWIVNDGLRFVTWCVHLPKGRFVRLTHCAVPHNLNVSFSICSYDKRISLWTRNFKLTISALRLSMFSWSRSVRVGFSAENPMVVRVVATGFRITKKYLFLLFYTFGKFKNGLNTSRSVAFGLRIYCFRWKRMVAGVCLFSAILFKMSCGMSLRNSFRYIIWIW